MPETLIKEPEIFEKWRKEFEKWRKDLQEKDLQEKAKPTERNKIKNPSQFLSGLNRILQGLKIRAKKDPSDAAVRDLIEVLDKELPEIMSKARKYVGEKDGMPFPLDLSKKVNDLAKKINDGGLLQGAILDVFNENYRPVMLKKWASISELIKKLAQSFL